MIIALLFACAGGGDTDTADSLCTTEARASVTVLVTGDDGQPLTPDGVTFQVDGTDPQEAQCVNASCTQWVAGWELTGSFEITATLGAEATVGSTVVGLDATGCHVHGQTLTLAFSAGDTGA
jgi:hypothetical protein